MKKSVLATISALLFLALMVAPAFSAQPTVNDDVWFVIAINPSSVTFGKIWWTGDGTVLHNQGTIIDALVYRSPPNTPPGSTIIGDATFEMNFVFDTASGEGSLNMKVILYFTETDSTKNPYGVGTLEGTLTAEVTTLHPHPGLPSMPGNAVGFVVATHGSGAFENANLGADLLASPLAGAPVEHIFFGTHWNVNGEGILIYHNPGP